MSVELHGKPVKVGDRVYSIVWGWGEVAMLDDSTSKILVRYRRQKIDCEWFAHDGRVIAFYEPNATVFWEETIPVNAKEYADLKVRLASIERETIQRCLKVGADLIDEENGFKASRRRNWNASINRYQIGIYALLPAPDHIAEAGKLMPDQFSHAGNMVDTQEKK